MLHVFYVLPLRSQSAVDYMPFLLVNAPVVRMFFIPVNKWGENRKFTYFCWKKRRKVSANVFTSWKYWIVTCNRSFSNVFLRYFCKEFLFWHVVCIWLILQLESDVVLLSALLYPRSFWKARFIHINIHGIYFTWRHTVHIVLFILPCPLCI
jgi:hypothetical protein